MSTAPRRSLRLAMVCALALLAATPALGGACGKNPCVTALSVVSAAGDEWRKAINTLEFSGDGLTRQSKGAIDTLARSWAASAKEPLQLRVAADASLQGSAATRQASARAQALKQALVDAGVPAAKVDVSF